MVVVVWKCWFSLSCVLLCSIILVLFWNSGCILVMCFMFIVMLWWMCRKCVGLSWFSRCCNGL